jgi:thiol-disulfide isomerase/thioredoxin
MLLCLATVALSSHAIAQDDEATLTIGSKAPDIEIEHWVSDNDGMFQHTSKLEKDNVYIIEFWATWCGPCIQAMPHIADLQEKYKDDNVQVISVSDEDMDTVEGFLERKVRGDEKERTYADLTNTYCLTTDPDKSVKKDYYYAAKRTGIPCAFIVGKTGLIEWIGHPMGMDKPLKQVVNDEWDREEFVVEYKKEQEKRANEMKSRRKMANAFRDIQELMNDDDAEGAIKLIEKFMADEDFADMKSAMGAQRLQIMIEKKLDGAGEALSEFVEENKDNGMGLNQIAWGIYEQHEAKGNVADDVLKAALKGAEYAAKAEPESGAILDTLAHLVYAVDGDLDRAIEVQTKALENANGQEGDIKPFLEQLKKEKETGKKTGKKKKSADVSDF